MECSHANSRSGGVLWENVWFILHEPPYISSITISQKKLENKCQLHESKELRKRELLFAWNLSAVWAQAVTHSQELPSSFLPSGKKKNWSTIENMCLVWNEDDAGWLGKCEPVWISKQSHVCRHAPTNATCQNAWLGKRKLISMNWLVFQPLHNHVQ